MDLSVFTGGSALAGNGGATEVGRQRSHLWMMVQQLQDSFTALEEARMPVLAAIQGGAIGGAVDMICAADMRYASADAFFCIQEINIGMTADVGHAAAPAEADPRGCRPRAGLHGRPHVRPSVRSRSAWSTRSSTTTTSLVAGVLDIAGRIATRSPLAIWGTKEMINFTRDHSVADALKYMAGWQSGMFQPTDMLEEFAAKGERRDPSFDELPLAPRPASERSVRRAVDRGA